MDRCFGSKNKLYSIYELAEECYAAIKAYYGPEKIGESITTKQIRNDIHFMKSMEGFDIEEELEICQYGKLPDSMKRLVAKTDSMGGSESFAGNRPNRRTYFFYKNKDFSISKRPLTGEDAERLKETLLTLQRFKGLPQFDWVEEMSARLHKFMDLGDVKNSVISFDANPHLEGLAWIEPLYQAILGQDPLVVHYLPFDKFLETHQISPFLLKQYNKRWFVLCKTDQVDHLTTLALDRIQGLFPGSHPFDPYPEDNPDDFFEDVVGVTNPPDKDPEVLVLDIEKSLWPYVRTKPLHGSQKLIKSTVSLDWVRVELTLKTNYEFYSVLLSHGARIRVVSPESSKNQMKKLIEDMAKLY